MRDHVLRMTAPQAIAQGSLQKTPLAHVLLSVEAKALTGTLVVWRDDGGAGQDRVRIESGHPVAARLLEPAQTLERGLLPLFSRTSAYAFYEADLVGEVGLRGEVDAWALILASLRGGARKDAMEAVLTAHGEARLRLRSGISLARFGLIGKERAFLDVLRAEPARVDDLVRQAADPRVPRRMLYLLTITQCLETFEGEFSRTSITEVARGVGERFSEVTREMASEARRRKIRRTGEDFDLPGLPSDMPPPPSSASVPASASAPRAATPTPVASGTRADGPELPPPPPAGLSDDDRTRWEEVSAFCARMDDQNYFEMLGIQQSASQSAVQDAYFKLIKKYHPDRLGPDVQALRPFADRIFQHLTEANETLSDEESRGAYLKTVQGGGGTPKAERAMNAVLSAAMEFQKVEVLVRRKDYEGALRILSPILLEQPDEPDYHAMKGLILFRLYGTEKKGQVDAALACLDEALKLYPKSERALLTKAQILQRTGKAEEAVALFRAVIEVNPKNVDAQRQVRLADMRSGDGPAKKKSKSKSEDGLFSKFFGKKK